MTKSDLRRRWWLDGRCRTCGRPLEDRTKRSCASCLARDRARARQRYVLKRGPKRFLIVGVEVEYPRERI